MSRYVLLAERLRQVEAQRDRAVAALRVLVELKDGPRDDRYRRRKPIAWQAARDALAELEES